jgi:hypothetical protein
VGRVPYPRAIHFGFNRPAVGLEPHDLVMRLDDNEFTPSSMEAIRRIQMYINLDQALVEVSEEKFLHVEKPVGMTIFCISGSLWITRKNCIKDFQLSPGDSYVADSPQPLTVCGFEPSVLRILQPCMERTISSCFFMGVRKAHQFWTRSIASMGARNLY